MPGMNPLEDIHGHYALAYAEREQPGRMQIPITCTSLQPRHLSQVHDLPTRAFWDGIHIFSGALCRHSHLWPSSGWRSASDPPPPRSLYHVLRCPDRLGDANSHKSSS
ncbi:hypothetical protein EDC04DRAFT_2642584 [Pisolithus marmoratus]|nr:hypothetical protein EDC04DRAFT_2642584 [Pisolithus marmoratus]